MSEEDTRNDGAIMNALTGLGTSLDKTESIQPGWGTKLNPQKQEELFLQPIIQNICAAYASEGTRAGWEITLGGDKQDPELIQAFDSYRGMIGSDDEDDELLSDVELIKTVQIWANIYGGAALVLNIDDGQPPNEPVDLTKINTIRSVEILDKSRISPDLTETVNPLRPTHYRILSAARSGDRLNLDTNEGRIKKNTKGDYYTYPIHRSRVISFYGRDGRILPPDLMSRLGNWGQSSIDAIWDDFKYYENVYRSIAAMVDDASLFVYYSKGLKKTVESGKEGVLRTRFASLRFGAKNLGGAALDLEEEKIEWLSRQFTGLPELSDRFRDRLVAVSGLPATVILGRGPLGLAAQGTGDAEEQVWERMVNNWQETVLRRKLRRLLRYIWLAKDGPTKGKEPPDWGFTYKALRVQSQQEKLDARASAGNTYLSYIQGGVLTADEVRESQFGGSEYSIEITLDKKAWDEKKKQEEEQANAFGGDYGGGYDPNAVAPEAAVPEEAPPQEEVVQDSMEKLRNDSCGCPLEDERLRSGVSTLDPYQQDQMILLRSRPISESGKETVIQSIAQAYPEEVADVEFYQINPDGSISGEFNALNNGIYTFKYQNGYLGYGWNRDSYHADAKKKSRRQGGKVWVEDKSVKGGGFWRKLPRGARSETPEPDKPKSGINPAIAIGAGLAGTALVAGGVAGAIALSGGSSQNKASGGTQRPAKTQGESPGKIAIPDPDDRNNHDRQSAGNKDKEREAKRQQEKAIREEEKRVRREKQDREAEEGYKQYREKLIKDAEETFDRDQKKYQEALEKDRETVQKLLPGIAQAHIQPHYYSNKPRARLRFLGDDGFAKVDDENNERYKNLEGERAKAFDKFLGGTKDLPKQASFKNFLRANDLKDGGFENAKQKWSEHIGLDRATVEKAVRENIDRVSKERDEDPKEREWNWMSAEEKKVAIEKKVQESTDGAMENINRFTDSTINILSLKGAYDKHITKSEGKENLLHNANEFANYNEQSSRNLRRVMRDVFDKIEEDFDQIFEDVKSKFFGGQGGKTAGNAPDQIYTGKSWHEVLDVPKGAGKPDVQKAYKKLLRKHHPDLNPNDPDALERAKEITAAYSVWEDLFGNRNDSLTSNAPKAGTNKKPRNPTQKDKKKLDSEEEKEPSDYLVEQAIATSAKPLNNLLKPIKSWMAQFSFLEEIRDNLPQLYDRLNGDTFGEHLEQWMLLAHLAGQTEVVEEYGSDDRAEPKTDS
jgi:phage-related protein (TIGR01555 family)